MQAFQFAITVDQVNCAELVSFELMARRAQMAELKHKQKFVPAPGVGSPDDPYQDTHLYMGISATRGTLAVHPSLEKHISSELKDEYKGLEAKRKAREE